MRLKTIDIALELLLYCYIKASDGSTSRKIESALKLINLFKLFIYIQAN